MESVKAFPEIVESVKEFPETVESAEEYLDGLAQGLALLTPYVTVEAAAVPDALYAQVRPHTGLPLLCITPRITVPEMGLDE